MQRSHDSVAGQAALWHYARLRARLLNGTSDDEEREQGAHAVRLSRECRLSALAIYTQARNAIVCANMIDLTEVEEWPG